MLVVSGAQFLEQEQRTLSKLDAALAAQRLGVNPRNCLVFEDSIAGVASARAAGAAVIAVGNATGHDPTISDYRALPNGFFTDITKLG